MPDWLHKRPLAPVKPYKSPTDLCRQKCVEWGVDFDPKYKMHGWPCVGCKGGTKPPENGEVCHLCLGRLTNELHVWRGFYASVMSEYQEERRRWQKLLAMHENIKRKLTPLERVYISIE